MDHHNRLREGARERTCSTARVHEREEEGKVGEKRRANKQTQTSVHFIVNI